MTYIKEYWSNKNELAAVAKKHTAEMAAKYEKEISVATVKTSVYNPGFTFKGKLNKDTKITVEDLDTVSA